jgi:hypothetical protein
VQDDKNPGPPEPALQSELRPELRPDSATADSGPHLPVPAADPALTIKPRRLAGNPLCLNCGTPLQGPFCHYCGQPDKNFLRFFPVLLRELLEDFVDFDSRFMRTMRPLLFKPGKLTRDYLDGRRFRYTPPLRLYIFSSIACFFVAALLASDALVFNGDGATADEVVSGVRIGIVNDPEVREALEGLDPETRAKVDEALREAAEAQDSNAAAGEPADMEPAGEDGAPGDPDAAAEDSPFMIGDKPWDRETNPFIVQWLPDWVNDWINDEIEQSPAKGREIAENPDLMREKIFDVLPATMFVLLPLVALLFKFWYLFARKYYIEHLIFALHNHAFLFVVLLISILLTSTAAWAEPAGEGRVTRAVMWANIAIGSWVPIYLLVSLKRVYRQGWFMTLTKYCVIGVSYLLLLSLASAFVALLSFVLL